MTATTSIDAKLRLPFSDAGVEFELAVGPAGAVDTGPEFSLKVFRLDSGEAVQFRSEASQVLADWVRGYTRWLYRAGVTAEFSDDSISGTFSSDLNAEQVLEGLNLACDMIRQRFELYDESILES